MMITDNMLVCDILEQYPQLEDVFITFGLNCIGCPGSSNESLSDAAEGHGIEIDKLLEVINREISE